MLQRWKSWARRLRREARAFYSAAYDPRVPWYAKWIVVATAAYAISPIDLVPDFIPVLGQLDDLIIVPLGLALAVWLIPADVLAEHRQRLEA